MTAHDDREQWSPFDVTPVHVVLVAPTVDLEG